jgi:branched-chain amino acid transport system substrate-binding protein
LCIKQAMKQADSAKPAAVIPRLRSMQYTGITGKISFDQYGDLKNPSSTLYEVKRGKWVPV